MTTNDLAILADLLVCDDTLQKDVESLLPNVFTIRNEYDIHLAQLATYKNKHLQVSNVLITYIIRQYLTYHTDASMKHNPVVKKRKRKTLLHFIRLQWLNLLKWLSAH